MQLRVKYANSYQWMALKLIRVYRIKILVVLEVLTLQSIKYGCIKVVIQAHSIFVLHGSIVNV